MLFLMSSILDCTLWEVVVKGTREVPHKKHAEQQHTQKICCFYLHFSLSPSCNKRGLPSIVVVVFFHYVKPASISDLTTPLMTSRIFWKNYTTRQRSACARRAFLIHAWAKTCARARVEKREPARARTPEKKLSLSLMKCTYFFLKGAPKGLYPNVRKRIEAQSPRIPS